FMLQSHYSSTLDFSNDALRGAEKGYKRMMEGYQTLQELAPFSGSTIDVDALKSACTDAMNDDFNTPVLISKLFDGVKTINLIKAGAEKATESDLEELKSLFYDFI